MAYPFAAAEVLTAVDLNAMIGAPTQNAQTGTTYTAVLLDAGKTVTLSNASAVTLTIPAQASVSWADNTQLNFLNLGAGTVTITPAAGVTINGTPLTLETSKGGSLVRTASNTWTFIPFSAGGVDNANFTNAATGTYTTGGKDYKYLTLTGSTSVIFDRAGFADILVVGGGGGGGAPPSTAGTSYGGGGSGGYLSIISGYFAVGTHTVTVGAGGSVQSTAGGGDSSISKMISPGGGTGGSFTVPATDGGYAGLNGGSGGGGMSHNSTYLSLRPGGRGITGLGNTGGNGFTATGTTSAGGGGGGSGAVGSNGASAAGGNGGAGTASSITGSAVTRAGGGGGGGYTTAGTGGSGGGGAGGTNASNAGTAGTANTGSGGGGTYSGISGGNGGSGIVIVRVVV